MDQSATEAVIQLVARELVVTLAANQKGEASRSSSIDRRIPPRAPS